MVTWNLRDTPESRARQHQAKIKGNSFDFEMISTCLLHETCWAVRPIGKGDQRLRRREKESTAPESVTHVVKGDKKVISSPLCVFVSLHHKKKRQPHERQNPWNKLINFIDHFGLSLDTKREKFENQKTIWCDFLWGNISRMKYVDWRRKWLNFR